MTESLGGMSTHELTQERRDLLEALATHRGFLRHTTDDLTDRQAAHRSTVSALTLGGLIKHVTATEESWAAFIVEGASSMPSYDDPAVWEEHADSFAMGEGETLAGLLERYAGVADRTDALIRSDAVDIDTVHALPEAPWTAPGATWSVRRALVHIVAETAQHAGHADIIREAIDGQRTMG